MQCPSCGFANPEGSRFCIECGAGFKKRCPACGFENLPRAKFCGDCGASLLTKNISRQTDSAPQAERRHLTVMFCDLVGSTALAERLDPEDLHAIMRSYHEVCAQVIGRFDGHIHQYLGDGILAYFGYPRAHEDDAQRSVRTGLGIIAAIEQFNRRLLQAHAVELAVRIGIHTGLVVVGETGSGDARETMAVGEPPNIAARIQALAEANAILISADTCRLIEGYFDCRKLGAYILKGISRPLPLYQALQESAARSRFDASASAFLAPLVGREKETALLFARWNAAKAGEGHALLLNGEPGIGKSRLVETLKEQAIRGSDAELMECRCSPYYQNSAFYPLIDLLERTVLRLARNEPDLAKLNKLERWLSQFDLPLAETTPLFASLLSLPLTEQYPLAVMTPERQRRETMNLLLNLLLRQTERQPVLAIIEDLHWADPSSLELLTRLIAHCSSHPILLLLTCRPEFASPWRSNPGLTQVDLGRLDHDSVEQLIRSLTNAKSLPPEILAELIAKTDGVPLFVEELTKTVLESDILLEHEDRFELAGPLRPLVIPATLDDSLMARLDRLAPVKAVAQLGATLGREFSYELLRAVSSLEETTLQHSLRQLVEAELLFQQGAPPDARYTFRHALIQEKAYQSLLKSVRHRYHQQIAHALTERFPALKETQPELVAYHFTEAGQPEQAIPYWQQAGRRAFQRSANMEAIAHFRRGLELVSALPDSPQRRQQELLLLLMLGPALVNTKGFASEQVGEVYNRAGALCRQFGETPQLFPAMWGLCGFRLLRAELEAAREIAANMVRLAERTRDPVQLPEAHYGLGCVLYFLGELPSARRHLERAIEFYDPARHALHAHRFGQDPGVCAQTYLAASLWYLGYPDQALQTIDEALTLARKLNHPYSLAQTLGFNTMLRFWRRDVDATLEAAGETIEFCTKQIFPIWLALGALHSGFALLIKNRQTAGIEQMERGFAAWRATRSELVQAYFLNVLAEGYGAVGRVQEAVNLANEALDKARQHGEARAEMEALKIKGDFLLKAPAPNPGEAESCFIRAIEISRRIEAKSRELQATMSLCRLWITQDKKEKARERLAAIYGWFSEGLDTADLREARTLLEQLS